jgi:hypothetical protein
MAFRASGHYPGRTRASRGVAVSIEPQQEIPRVSPWWYGTHMAPRLEEDHSSIVLVGVFDPLRFQPHWFRSEKLLGEAESEHADIKIIHAQLVDWSTDWFDLQVVATRFAVTAKVESRAESLRDLAIGTFQLLEHTVTSALGMNRTMHYDVGGEENWNRIGDTLAPKDLWRPSLRNRPGMRTLQIEETKRADGLPGRAVITVQPSLKYKHGVFFDVNNEVRPEGEISTPFFVDVIRDHWQRVLDEGKTMAEDVLGKACR